MPPIRRFVLLCTGTALVWASGCAAPSKAFVAPPFETCVVSPGESPGALKVVSFNIRSGLSSSIEQVADVLASLNADVIAVQEVDVGVARTHRHDQAKILADRLGMQRIFAGAIKREGGDYGVAMLTRLPVAKASRINLSASMAYEPRVAIDATLCHHGREVRVITVHADVLPWAGAANAGALAKVLKDAKGRIIVAGDLNATPKDAAVRSLTGVGLKDLIGLTAEGPTFLGSDRRIDYVFANNPLDTVVLSARRIDTRVSDHIPVFVEFGAGLP